MRTVRLAAAGHPAVTGRHGKTLELTAAAAISARATCILAVSAGPMPGELPLLRGRVRLTLAAGGASAAVEGEVNPGWHSAESLIVRRSGQTDADTYLVNATAAAADLPADLLAALREPGEAVEITAEEVGTPAPVVLVLTGGPATDEIARLAAQAELVVDLTGRGSPAPPVPLPGPRRHRLPDPVTARTTVVLTDDPAAALPVTRGSRVVLWPPAPGADLLLSAGLPPAPLLQAGRVPTTAAARAELTRLLARTPAPAALDPAGTDLAELAPHHTVLVPTPDLGWGVQADPAAAAPRERRVVVVVPERGRAGGGGGGGAGPVAARGRAVRPGHRRRADRARRAPARGLPARRRFGSRASIASTYQPEQHRAPGGTVSSQPYPSAVPASVAVAAGTTAADALAAAGVALTGPSGAVVVRDLATDALRDLDWAPDAGCPGRAGRAGLRRRPLGAAALDRARDGPGRAGPVPGHPARHRPADRERLLLRLPAGPPVHPGRPRPDRQADAGDRQGRAALLPPAGLRRRGAGRAGRRAVQAGADRAQGRRGGHRGRLGRGRRPAS